jgi:hypothetical protein
MKMSRHRNIYKIAAIALALAGGVEAAPKSTAPKTVAPKTVAPAPSTTVRGIDPLSLSADQTLITTIAPQIGPIGAKLASGSGVKSLLIFRVQILTAQGFGEARKAALVAEEIFDQAVHIDYEIPNFKVRVGDFNDRAAADTYRRTAQQLGYTNCWVIPVTIGIAEASPLYDSLVAPVDSVSKTDSVKSNAGGK